MKSFFAKIVIPCKNIIHKNGFDKNYSVRKILLRKSINMLVFFTKKILVLKYHLYRMIIAILLLYLQYLHFLLKNITSHLLVNLNHKLIHTTRSFIVQ